MYGKENGNKISTSFHADTLQTMLEKFEQFLRGSGFYFEGVVDIVPEEGSEEETVKISIDNHSEHYYDFDRNKSPAVTNDWDNYSDLPSPNLYKDTGAAQPTMNVGLSDDLFKFDTYEIKMDSSNIFYTQFDTMAGNFNER
jgi:uncharacterized protein YbbC (DUF1343 family)